MNREEIFPQNALFCSLCSGHFDIRVTDKVARILPCLHVFCHGCISSKLTNNRVECPSCGEIHRTGDYLNCFPRDLTLSLLQDTVRVKQSSTRPTCFSCHSDAAVNFVCQECSCRYICEQCRIAHENLACLADHKTFALSYSNSVLVKNVHRRCNIHTSKKIDRFCESKECKVPICKKCQKCFHESHDVRKIKDICVSHESDIVNAKKRIIAKKEEICDSLLKARKTSSDTTEYKTQTEKFLNESFENSCQLLTDLKIKTKKRLQSDYKKQYNTIDDQISNLMTAKHAVDRCEEYLTYSLEYKSTDDLLECSRTVQKRADNLQSQTFQTQTVSPTELSYSNLLPKPIIHGPSTTLILSGKAYAGRKHAFHINLKNRDQTIVNAKQVGAFVRIYREDGNTATISQNIDSNGAINITWIPIDIGNCTVGVLVFMGTIEVWNQQLQVEDPSSIGISDMSEAQTPINPSQACRYHGLGDDNNEQRQFEDHPAHHTGDVSAVMGFADIVGKQSPTLPIGTYNMLQDKPEYYDNIDKDDKVIEPDRRIPVPVSQDDKVIEPDGSIPVPVSQDKTPLALDRNIPSPVLQEKNTPGRGPQSTSSSAPTSTMSEFITKFADLKRTKSDGQE